MFQIQSSDYGKTWTKEYTNITDAVGSSPSMILDEDTGKVTLYFFARSSGQLKRRIVNVADVWDNPLNWTSSEVLITEPYKGQDTGNVKVVEKDGLHYCAYYAGTSTTTGVYGVIINPHFNDGNESEQPKEKIESTETDKKERNINMILLITHFFLMLLISRLFLHINILLDIFSILLMIIFFES